MILFIIVKPQILHIPKMHVCGQICHTSNIARHTLKWKPCGKRNRGRLEKWLEKRAWFKIIEIIIEKNNNNNGNRN